MNGSSEPTLFCDRLIAAIEARQSTVVVGLDPHLELFPPPLLEDWPEGGQPVKDAWCVVYDSNKDTYLDRWDIIEAALS